MSPLKRNILLITVIAAAIMELIDTSIVNVALNYMSGNLGATLEDVSWVITSYAIASVAAARCKTRPEEAACYPFFRPLKS